MPKRARQEAAVVDGAEPPDLSTWLTYKAVAEANRVTTDMELVQQVGVVSWTYSGRIK
jgi:hypothetical protein